MSRSAWLRRPACGVALAVACLPLAARAQLLEDPPTVELPPPPDLTDTQSIFVRTGDVPVRERRLPAFTAQGVPFGAFRLYPGLALASEATSNVFADNDRRRSDVGLIARPELTLRTDAGPYRFSLGARGDLRRYAGHPSENTEEGLVEGDAQLAVGALSSVFAGARFGSFVLSRTAADSPRDAAKPLEYSALDAHLGARIEGARTRLIVRADVARLRFGDTPSLSGGELFTRDRDRARYAGSLRVERALSPALSVYLQGTINRIDYSIAPVGIGTRDSWGYGAYVGSSFELSRLARGDVRVGYVRQNFDLTGARPIAGLGAEGNVVLFPSRVWDINLHAESSVLDTGVPGSRGLYRRGGTAGADIELRRFLRANVSAGYFRDNYRGADRRDNVYRGEVGATYLSAGHWNAQLRYRFDARDSTRTTFSPNFDEHRLVATLTFQI